MTKTLTALAAASAIALATVAMPTQADAGSRGGAVAAGVLGGLAAGAIIGGAIANARGYYGAPPPAYYAPPAYGPAPVYVEPRCYYTRGEPVWDVVARYLKSQKTISPRALELPKLEGVAGNPGLA